MSQGQIQKNIFSLHLKDYRNVTKPIGSKSYQISCEGYNEYKFGLK
jgi:hypothetical protein